MADAPPLLVEIVEPPSEYVAPERDGMILVRCGCSCADSCPQGRRGTQAACQVWLDASLFRRKALARLREPIRR